MSLHANRVQMTVSAVDGVTGELTLGAASVGYRSFSTAYGATATVDILITESAFWEIDRNCTYNHSTGKVNRGTFESSSSGIAVTFTSAAIVSVIASAASGNNWGLNEVIASVTGSNVTGVVGTMHQLDLAGLTADRDFTLPGVCNVGDRVGVYVTTGDDLHELVIKPAAGDTINGGAAGAEWSRLFISNEYVVFRCTAKDASWVVEYDGRIPMQVLVTGNGSTQQVVAGGFAKLTTVFATIALNVGNAWDDTNKDFRPRRAGTFLMSGGVAINSIAATTTVSLELAKNATEYLRIVQTISTGSAAAWHIYGSGLVTTTVASDAFALYATTAAGFITFNGAAGATRSFLSAVEIL